MEDAFEPVIYGPEFTYNGDPVGLFKHGIAPSFAGEYAYEPFRGAGHYKMATDLDHGARPKCSYIDGGLEVSFDVVAHAAYGVLVLDNFHKVGEPE